MGSGVSGTVLAQGIEYVYVYGCVSRVWFMDEREQRAAWHAVGERQTRPKVRACTD